MRSTLLLTVLLLAAAPVMAQQTMVSASLTGDIARFTSIDTPVTDFGLYAESPLDGEALGFTVGIGRALGERWGVALEVGRTGEIENRRERRIDPRILAVPVSPTAPTSPVLPPFPIPELAFESRTELQLTTISALAWVKHAAGSRVELSYTGGLTLVQSESESEITIADERLAFWALPAGFETTEHRAAPVVGMDAAIRFTDHTALTAGIRVHAVTVSGTAGWLVRPAVGVRWSF